MSRWSRARGRRMKVGLVVGAVVSMVALPNALAGGVKVKTGTYSGASLIKGQAPVPGGYRFSFKVSGKPPKASDFVTDARRCDGALTRFEASGKAGIKNGKFTLKDTTHFTDGFVTVTVNGHFTTSTRGTGTVDIDSEYKGQKCNYTMQIGRLGPGGGRPTKPHH